MKWNEFNSKMKDMSMDYMDHNKQSRRQMYKTYVANYMKENMNINYEFVTPGCIMTTSPNYFTLAPLQAATLCQTAVCDMAYGCKPKQKGNNPMYVDNDKHIESSKINYLSERAHTIHYIKEQDMLKTFGLTNDETPSTPAEFVKRIQDGKFVLSKETEDKHVYEPTRYIRWRDPAVKEDKDGYKAALTVFSKVFQDTNDMIAIGTPAEGLSAVKALDAWTPTVGTA